jgi:hypothetical protein
MDLKTVQKLILINVDPVLKFIQETDLSNVSFESTYEYLSTDEAKQLYLFLSIMSTYGTVCLSHFRFPCLRLFSLSSWCKA